MELKSNLTCSLCSKIFKTPIKLPCNDTICELHLSEPNVVEYEKIRCAKCDQEFKVGDIELVLNEDIQKLLENEEHLTKDEKKQKKSLEKSFEKFQILYEEFIQIRNSLETECHDKFQEIRRKIDLRREELKAKIDQISLEMIEKTKLFEAAYQESIKENLEHNSIVPKCEKILAEEKCDMEEIFRAPNPSVELISLKKSLKKQSNCELKSKFHELVAIKDHLRTKNDFISRYQLSSNAFGLLYLNMYDPFNSQILALDQSLELVKICEFSLRDKWSLVYRASLHGFGSKDFHDKCDGKKNTITIIKAANSSFIFGGFTTAAWDQMSGWKRDPDSFIFSLTNKGKEPVKIKIAPTRTERAIFCCSNYGASFGRDLEIINEGMGKSDLGYNYRHDRYHVTSDRARSFLAGSSIFLASEIEVYLKI